MIKSFRGKLADGGQDTIRLSTNKGQIGYKIKKFQVIGPDSHENIEATIKIYKYKQDTFNDDINLNDPTLLAVIVYIFPQHSSNTAADTIIFDNAIFNQDIFITQSGHGYQTALNYYIELEQVKLNVDEAAVATLKDMRGTE